MKLYRIKYIPESSTVKYLGLYNNLVRFIDWYYTDDDIIGSRSTGVGTKRFTVHIVRCLRKDNEVNRQLLDGYYYICKDSVVEEPYIRTKVEIEI